jgi:hypothetical protein
MNTAGQMNIVIMVSPSPVGIGLAFGSVYLPKALAECLAQFTLPS